MEFFDKVKDFINYNKVTIIGGIVVLIIVLGSNFGIYAIVNNKISDVSEKQKSVSFENDETVEEKETEKEYYQFDIKGSVNKPGVYSLEKGSRVIDAIKIAGGLKENADTSVNNLSKYITDEMVIVIYNSDEVFRFNEIKEQEEIENNECKNYNEVVENESCIEKSDIIASEVDTKISINTASLELLMTLPGIGESKAKSIIEYREEKGIFKSIEDIMNVSGIGESVFEKIKNYITV
ncbi:MAG: helix-hairpin-helix domain-containing protein [Bacilli bacterium]|nr:helix-hairpin-helix domain-containing protein [Bacilli bacterium]